MTKNDLLEIAKRIGENKMLCKNIRDMESREQAESMSDVIAWEIKEYFKDNFTTGYTMDEWREIQDEFFRLSLWDKVL